MLREGNFIPYAMVIGTKVVPEDRLVRSSATSAHNAVCRDASAALLALEVTGTDGDGQRPNACASYFAGIARGVQVGCAKFRQGFGGVLRRFGKGN